MIIVRFTIIVALLVIMTFGISMISSANTAPPTVVMVGPMGTSVLVENNIQITFNETMDHSQTDTICTISPTVDGTFQWAGRNGETLIFTPENNLAYSTTYNVVIKGTVEDQSGNTLDGNENGIQEGSPTDDYSWQFTTEPPPSVDEVPPQVTRHSPVGLAVLTNATIEFSFDEEVLCESAIFAFQINPVLNGEFDMELEGTSSRFVYYPNSLATGTTYEVTISATVQDTSGNTLDGNQNGVEDGSPVDDYSWEFTTTATDTSNPTIRSHYPVTNAMMSLDLDISITFSETMQTGTVENNFTIEPAVEGLISWEGTEMTFTPNSDLSYSTRYYVNVTAQAMDMAGLGLDGNVNGVWEDSPTDDYSWSFETIPEPDTTPPTITDVSPTGFNLTESQIIVVNFSEPVDTTTFTPCFSITPSVPGDLNYPSTIIHPAIDVLQLVFTPSVDLVSGINYTVTITSVVRDKYGHTLDGNGNGIEEGSPIDDYSWEFNVGGIDDIGPTVLENTPTGSGVSIESDISIEFGEPMNMSSVEEFFSITPQIEGTLEWVLNTLTFSPAHDLEEDTTYTVKVKANATDNNGNILDGDKDGIKEGTPVDDYSWEFTTEIIPLSTVVVNKPKGDGISNSAEIELRFSLSMNRTVTENAFSITPALNGIIIWDSDHIMKLLPEETYDFNMTYTVKITNSAISQNGKHLDGNGNGVNDGSPVDDFSWNFTIEKEDQTPPTIVEKSPVGINISVNSPVQIEFSELMNKKSVEDGFSIEPAITGTYLWESTIFNFIPNTRFEFNTLYYINLSDSAKDISGNLLNTDGETMLAGPTNQWTFVTENMPEYLAPVNLVATVDGNTINLTWGMPDGGPVPLGFNVFRAESLSGEFAKINAEQLNVSKYSDTGLEINKTYYYKVKAIYEGYQTSGFSSMALGETEYEGGTTETDTEKEGEGSDLMLYLGIVGIVVVAGLVGAVMWIKKR